MGLESQVVSDQVLAYYMIIVRPIPIFLNNFILPNLLFTAIVLLLLKSLDTFIIHKNLGLVIVIFLILKLLLLLKVMA